MNHGDGQTRWKANRAPGTREAAAEAVKPKEKIKEVRLGQRGDKNNGGYLISRPIHCPVEIENKNQHQIDTRTMARSTMQAPGNPKDQERKGRRRQRAQVKRNLAGLVVEGNN
ncbi:hypothetical protein TESG_05576 [Trichophyton tonsurans CBS 112818]|uniref:Uncharacterized protein n=1 Tax=Trichophyton tonsurans (strain CBS 112818) TaxID=647933 RepID=F2S3P1_TRIT1|nr:hypothetical protein TESG_05576 [Trichophyton tonsurans CBS 112818]